MGSENLGISSGTKMVGTGTTRYFREDQLVLTVLGYCNVTHTSKAVF